MRFVNPLPFVTDMERSRHFYRDMLGLEIIADHGNFVLFAGGFALHEGTSLLAATYGAAAADNTRRHAEQEPGPTGFGRNNLVLYFEVEDEDSLDAAFARLRDRVDLIHPLRREPWGGRVFRFRDPDGHIIEVGEPDAQGDLS
ncbi:VOC family protein [Roseibium sp. Sym1]|uniref:VOC family protein n=1 Tax=Roseibium sp. Sym1 TaxID=3016006 RepID=UPI0022B51012|nr:VOC family protein [Roseibium sp. Sym1]